MVAIKAKKCILFTFQNLAPGSRKTGMTFIADALNVLGCDVEVVTVQVSLMSQLSRAKRLRSIPKSHLNRWIGHRAGLRSFVWCPVIHPVGASSRVPSAVGTVLAKVYPYLLPGTLLKSAASADLIVIESCAAISLFGRLKRVATNARFVYCASDRLETVGMHPYLIELLQQSSLQYDLIRLPAEMMAVDFPPGAKLAYLPHGLQKEVFDEAAINPYVPGTINAVVAGDMNSDLALLERLIQTNQSVDFHIFGMIKFGSGIVYKNAKMHGEVGFTRLAPYIKFADVGIAPYSPKPGAEYLSQSSLKLMQYTYCKLPIIAPSFVKAGRAHILDYDPADFETVESAFRLALSFDRSTIDTSQITGWDIVAKAILGGESEYVSCRSDSTTFRQM